MRSLRLLAAALTVPLFSVAAQLVTDDVISLPEFKVFEGSPLPAREKWDYGRVGSFEILSNTSPRTTKRFAKNLSEFQRVLGIVAPEMLIKAEQPVMVVLCARNTQFERFRVKSASTATDEQITSLVRDNEIASIVVDFETRAVRESGGGPIANVGGHAFSGLFTREINTTEEFIRQYIHLSLSQLSPRPPAWVAEGLANIYSNIDYNNKWIEIGQPRSFINEVTYTSPGYSGIGGSNQDFAGFHRAVGTDNYGTGGSYGGGYGPTRGESYTYQIPMVIMPMEKLFAVSYDSPLLKPGGKDTATSPGWKTQATAFVHLCVYGENGRYRQSFLKFVTRSYTEPVTEALFKECFGVSYKEMALRIRGYTEFTTYLGTTIKATKGGILYPADPIDLRPANDAEIGRIKGETYRLSGQEEAARREFVVAYLRGERDPQLLASLGLMARQRHDDARARTYLEAVGATATPVPRPRAYLELAKLRAATQEARTGTKPYDTEQTINLLTPLFVAQRQPQQLAAIYLEIARVWENTAVVPERDHLGALEYGVLLFPQNDELTLRTADLLIKHGHKAAAAAMIFRALRTTRDPEFKAKFDTLRQKIDGPPVSVTDLPPHILRTS
jgi:hypothetical protein